MGNSVGKSWLGRLLVCGLVSVLFIGIAGQSRAADVDLGHELYEQRCLGCHEPGHNTKGKQTVTDVKGLATWVARCNNGIDRGEQWFDDEEAAVTEFLRRTYYKF